MAKLDKNQRMKVWQAVYDAKPKQMTYASLKGVAKAVPLRELFSRQREKASTLIINADITVFTLRGHHFSMSASSNIFPAIDAVFNRSFGAFNYTTLPFEWIILRS